MGELPSGTVGAMHHLRLQLVGSAEARQPMRERLLARGAHPIEADGALLVLATPVSPEELHPEVMAGLRRGRVDVERFELLGRRLVTERWNPRSLRSEDVRRLDADEPERELDSPWAEDWPYDRYGRPAYGWRPPPHDEQPAVLSDELRLTALGVLARAHRPDDGAREGALGLLADLGRLAATRDPGHPALLDAAAFVLARGARAAARDDHPAERDRQRARLVTLAAWAAARRAGEEPALDALAGLASAASELLTWAEQPVLWRRGTVEPVCRAALTAVLAAIAGAGSYPQTSSATSTTRRSLATSSS